VSLTISVVALTRPREARRGVLLAAISLLAGVVLVVIPGRFRLGPLKPPIHDIITDTQEPPEYVAVLPLRATAPNTTVYGGEKIASRQRNACPDLQPLIRRRDGSKRPIQPCGTASRTCGHPGEAVRWSSRIDVRSLFPVGGGDAGTNAKRVWGDLDALRIG
jgi:hypothetical protein